MAKLVIEGKNPFRPMVREHIFKDDIFCEQYKRACDILDGFLDASNDEKSGEYNNNIIAFCGERGYGKTSAMHTFANSIYNHDKSNDKDKDKNKDKNADKGTKEDDCIDIDNFYDKIKNTFFDKPIIIDPSMFDKSHNIIDIVLAQLYREFKDKIDKEMEEHREKDNYYARQKLLNCFEKVYKCVSLIADPAKVKEHEFDYDGNMGKLSKLGESTRLKEYLKELVDEYLKFIDKDGSCSKDNKRKLIIAIDDLDLCNENAYKLSEQIRKYLIIPNVIIIMAVRIDQLQLGVMEHNLANFKKLSKKYNDDKLDIFRQVHTMSEKYITKLIPQNNRIYIPNMSLNKDAIIEYNDKSSGKTLVDDTLQKIYEKTGMIFVKDKFNNSYHISNSIREFVDFYIMLIEVLKTAGDENRYSTIKSNIRTFYEYYKSVFIDSVQPSIKRGLDFVTENDNNIHFKSIYFLLNQQYDEIDSKCKEDIREIFNKGLNNEKKNSFSDVLKVLSIIDDRVNTEDVKKCANMIKVIYTAYLTAYREIIENNEKKQYLHTLDEINYRKFIGDSIWGGMFDNVLPKIDNENSMAKFDIKTIDMINIINNNVSFEYETDDNEDEDINKIISENRFVKVDGALIRVVPLPSRIYEYKYSQSYRNAYILYWIIIGLFVNTTDGKTVIDDYGCIDSKLSISIENYIYGLNHLNGLYDRLNLSMAGIEFTEFHDVVQKIENDNKGKAECFRRIVSSMDILLDLPRYCSMPRTSMEKLYENTGISKEELEYIVGADELFVKIKSYLKEKIGKMFEIPDKFGNLEITADDDDDNDNDNGGCQINVLVAYKQMIAKSSE